MTQHPILSAAGCSYHAKKWSLSVHWWDLNYDNLDFQEQWVSSLPETHWVTPPAMGNFSPCPGTCHCQPLNWSLQQHPACLPWVLSFPKLPWIAASGGLVDSTAPQRLWLHHVLFLSNHSQKPFLTPNTPNEVYPRVSTTENHEQGCKACLKDLPLSSLFCS